LKRIRIAIVISEFNSEITSQMLEKAKKHAIEIHADARYICYVPGSFDMPLMVEELLKKRDVDAVVTLGAIIKGQTNHDEIVASNVARLITDLSVKYSKPVSLGIAGPNMTLEQAMERVRIVPERAVNAAVKMVLRVKELKEQKRKIRESVRVIY